MKFNQIIVIIILIFMSCTEKKTYTIYLDNELKIIRNSNNPLNKKFKINFKKISQISFIDEKDTNKLRNLNWPNGIIADSEKNIYIYDYMKSTIKKFDFYGNFISGFCRKGNGPGEANIINYVYIKNDTLHVCDDRSKKILQFEKTGKFIKTTYISNPFPNNVIPFKNNKLISEYWELVFDKNNKNKIWINNSIGISNLNFKNKKIIINTKNHRDINNVSIMDAKLFYACTNNRIFIGKVSEEKYEIEVYNDKLNKIYKITKNYKKIKMTLDQKNAMNNFITTDKKSTVTEKCSKAILGMWLDKNKRLWIASSRNRKKGDYGVYCDIFEDGIYLNTVSIPNYSSKSLAFLWQQIFFIGKYLYIIDEKNGVIQIYNY